MIFNILDNTTELWMTKYIIGEIFSSSGATLYKNHSDQIVQKPCISISFSRQIIKQFKKRSNFPKVIIIGSEFKDFTQSNDSAKAVLEIERNLISLRQVPKL